MMLDMQDVEIDLEQFQAYLGQLIQRWQETQYNALQGTSTRCKRVKMNYFKKYNPAPLQYRSMDADNKNKPSTNFHK